MWTNEVNRIYQQQIKEKKYEKSKLSVVSCNIDAICEIIKKLGGNNGSIRTIF